MDSESPAPQPAPVTTIAWRLAHMIVSCMGYRVHWYFGGPEVGSESFEYAGTANEALRQFDEMYARWDAGVRQLSDVDLDHPPAVGLWSHGGTVGEWVAPGGRCCPPPPRGTGGITAGQPASGLVRRSDQTPVDTQTLNCALLP